MASFSISAVWFQNSCTKSQKVKDSNSICHQKGNECFFFIKKMLGLSLSYGSSLDVPKHWLKSIYFDRGKLLWNSKKKACPLKWNWARYTYRQTDGTKILY